MKKNLNQIKKWHNNGHEIGNHSYNHLFNFGSLDSNNLKDEIFKTHEKIFSQGLLNFWS